MQLAERYVHERMNLNWKAAADLFTLILAALLVFGMILVILYLLLQHERHVPSIEERPVQSANLRSAHFRDQLRTALRMNCEYIDGGTIPNS